MFRGCRVAAVVPAFNEARHIRSTLLSLPHWLDDVIVVDDASSDGTAEIAAAALPSAHVCRLSLNRGAGGAICEGYLRAFQRGADIAVVLAGDGQMDPCDLPHVLGPVADGSADYCKGDRLSFPGAFRRMPVSRWVGNQLLSRCTSLALGRTVRDSQCGYAALSRDGADRLPLERLWPRYGYPNDLLALCTFHGLRTVEVQVRPVYGDEASGVALRDACVVIPWLLLRAFVRRRTRSSRAARSVPVT